MKYYLVTQIDTQHQMVYRVEIDNSIECIYLVYNPTVSKWEQARNHKIGDPFVGTLMSDDEHPNGPVFDDCETEEISSEHARFIISLMQTTQSKPRFKIVADSALEKDQVVIFQNGTVHLPNGKTITLGGGDILDLYDTSRYKK